MGSDVGRWLCKVDDYGQAQRWFRWTAILAERRDMFPVTGPGIAPKHDVIEARRIADTVLKEKRIDEVRMEANRTGVKSGTICRVYAREIQDRIVASLPVNQQWVVENVSFVNCLDTVVTHFLGFVELHSGTPSQTRNKLNQMLGHANKIESLWDELDSLAESEMSSVSAEHGTSLDKMRWGLNKATAVIAETEQRFHLMQKPRPEKLCPQQQMQKKRRNSPKKENRRYLIVKIGEAIENCLEVKANTGLDGLLLNVADVVFELVGERKTHPEELVEAVRLLRYHGWSHIWRQIVRIEYASKQMDDQQKLVKSRKKTNRLLQDLTNLETALHKDTVSFFRISGAEWKEKYIQRMEQIS